MQVQTQIWHFYLTFAIFAIFTCSHAWIIIPNTAGFQWQI